MNLNITTNKKISRFNRNRLLLLHSSGLEIHLVGYDFSEIIDLLEVFQDIDLKGLIFRNEQDLVVGKEYSSKSCLFPVIWIKSDDISFF